MEKSGNTYEVLEMFNCEKQDGRRLKQAQGNKHR